MKLNAFGRVTRLMHNTCKWIEAMEKNGIMTSEYFEYEWINNKQSVKFTFGTNVIVIYDRNTKITKVYHCRMDNLIYDSSRKPTGEDDGKIFISSIFMMFERYVEHCIRFVTM